MSTALPERRIELIEKSDSLAAAVAELTAFDGPLALDTEADSFHHYAEKVCLLQIGTPGRAFLVDPLAGLDLTELLALLQSRPLIMHGADYDLRLLFNQHGFRALAVFETMIAAQLLGEKEIGLQALLGKRLSVTLDKAHQRADWSLRPLSPAMIDYAAADVLHLHALADSLSRDLARLSRVEWHREECARLVVSELKSRPEDPENDWRLKGTNALTARERAFVRALWLARERRSAEIDRPPFRILTNEKLIAGARLAAAGETDLFRLFGDRPLPSAVARSLRAALDEARALPQTSWPGARRGERVETEPALDKAIDRLKKVRDEKAQALGLDPGILASRATLTAAARALLDAPADTQLDARSLSSAAGISFWRAQLLV